MFRNYNRFRPASLLKLHVIKINVSPTAAGSVDEANLGRSSHELGDIPPDSLHRFGAFPGGLLDHLAVHQQLDSFRV